MSKNLVTLSLSLRHRTSTNNEAPPPHRLAYGIGLKRKVVDKRAASSWGGGGGGWNFKADPSRPTEAGSNDVVTVVTFAGKPGGEMLSLWSRRYIECQSKSGGGEMLMSAE